MRSSPVSLTVFVSFIYFTLVNSVIIQHNRFRSRNYLVGFQPWSIDWRLALPPLD